MTESTPLQPSAAPTEVLPPDAALAVAHLPLTPAGQAALAAAQALAKKATAAATLRAYKADWTHFSQWCAAHGFVAVPAAPAVVGARLASLAGSHAPTTIRRRLPAAGATARLLLFGFVAALRRSELVALRIEDVGVVGCSIAVAAAILT